MKKLLFILTLLCFSTRAMAVSPPNTGRPASGPPGGDTKPPDTKPLDTKPLDTKPTSIGKVTRPVNTTALALSGGGAKGSFQVGALRYLYDHVFDSTEPLPQIMAGTSVGAVNAAKLAEGGRAPFNQLESIWLGLQHDSDMYESHDWVDTLNLFQRKLVREFADANIWDFVGTFFEVLFQDEVADYDIDTLKSAFARAQSELSIYHLGPLASIMDGGALRPDKIMASKIKLRLSVVNLHDGRLRYVTEEGRMLERDYQPAGWTNLPGRNEFIPPPCKTISDNVKKQLQQLDAGKGEGQPGEVPVGSQKGSPGTESPSTEYEAEYKEIMKPLRQCLADHPIVSLRNAVLASSAIPAVFGPQRLLGGLYVDGGVREVVPVQVAVDLGADKVYAIVAGLRESKPPDYIENIPDVAIRALNITLDEVVKNETERMNLWQDKSVVVIAPNYEVHDALTIEPGLIRIAMAYGYMRAADMIETAGKMKREQAMHLADEIARRRVFDFNVEKLYSDKAQNAHFKENPNPGRPISEKHGIRKMVRERLELGFSVPPNIERAWMSWECHATAQFLPQVWPASSVVPAACTTRADRLKKREKDRRDLKPPATTQGSEGPKPGKPDPEIPDPEIEKELKALDKEIAQLKGELKQCILDNTPPDPVRHGLLIKSASSSDVFVLYGGSKLLLRGKDPVKEMGYDPSDVLVVPKRVLDRLPQDRPVNGTLLGNNKGEVFRMENGKKKTIVAPAVPAGYSPNTYKAKFTSFDQDAWEIRLVPEETLKAIQ